jgi:hypothetical protein
VPNQPFELTVDLHFTSWTFAKGHRLRVAVNNSQWPMLWPTPYPFTSALQLGAGKSRISLPVVPHAERPVPQFEPPFKSPTMPGFATLDAGTSSGYGEISSVDRNPQTGEVRITATNSGGQRYPWGVERYHETIEHRVTDGAPEKAALRGTHRMEVSLPAASWSGGGTHVHERSRRVSLRLSPPPVRKRQAVAREELARRHPARFSVS